jgi:HK97 family phage portal protein
VSRRKTIARSLSKLEQLLADVQSQTFAGSDLQPWELPIVVACRRVLADTVAQLPLVAFTGGQPRNPQPPIVVRPDPLEPVWLTKSRIVDNLTRRGHVWLLPTAWGADGWPNTVQVIDADRGAATFDADGRIVDVNVAGEWCTIGPGPGEVIWLPYAVPFAGSPGEPPMRDCWRAVEFLAALYEMAGSFWEAGFPSLALTIARRLDPDDAKKLKDQLLQSWSRRHEPAVIDNGATLTPIGSSAVESQLVESMQWANAEITRTFGVMPSIVNVAAGDSLTYSTTEGEFTKWRAIGLGPYLARIEGAFTDLMWHGTTARFDTVELLRADLATQGNYYTQALGGAPWLTVDEVRAVSLNLPPMPGGPGQIPALNTGTGDRAAIRSLPKRQLEKTA